ncbi:MAG: cytochrome P450 [Pseudomonadota bacterium]|nr:cytochrome P450 [Pseudomonadota bacterium]
MAEDIPRSIADVSAFDPEARLDPHPKLKRLRDACPVLYDEAGKTWFLTRYEDVRGVIHDKSIARHPKLAEAGSFVASFDSSNLEIDGQEPRADTILSLDDPDHTRIRIPFTEAFYPRVKGLTAEIEAMVDAEIAALPARGQFDLVEDIALGLPIKVIAKIIGVDESMLDQFRAWSEAIVYSLDPLRTPEQTEQMIQAGLEINAYFLNLMAQRRTDPRDDLTTDMVRKQADGAELSDAEIAANLELLLSAGNLTTTDMIGVGTWLFLNHPSEIAKLNDDPALAGLAVEEVLRMDGPAAVTTRVIMDAREMRGCPMKAHQPMLVSLHGANHDPDVFEDPDTFNISRKGPPHVAFGGGQHICLGAPLARIEGKRFFLKLFERYPDLRIADQPNAVEFRALPLFRGLTRLIVDTGR